MIKKYLIEVETKDFVALKFARLDPNHHILKAGKLQRTMKARLYSTCAN
jgi:hypothetical protein